MMLLCPRLRLPRLGLRLNMFAARLVRRLCPRWRVARCGQGASQEAARWLSRLLARERLYRRDNPGAHTDIITKLPVAPFPLLSIFLGLENGIHYAAAP